MVLTRFSSLMVYSSTSDELSFREGKWTQSTRCFKLLSADQECLQWRKRAFCESKMWQEVGRTAVRARESSGRVPRETKDAGWWSLAFPGQVGFCPKGHVSPGTCAMDPRASVSHLCMEVEVN